MLPVPVFVQPRKVVRLQTTRKETIKKLRGTSATSTGKRTLKGWTVKRHGVSLKKSIPKQLRIIFHRRNWRKRVNLRDSELVWKDQARRSIRLSRNIKRPSVYTKQRDKTKKLIRQAQANYEKRLMKEFKNKPKAFYSYVRSKQNVKVGVS